MAAIGDNTHYQADCHPIVVDENFSTIEEYCLHLIHLRAYEEAAALSAAKFVLDLGCNNGYGTAVISRGCARVAGLDVSPKAIEAAKQRFGDLGIDFRLFDGGRIPFEDASIDVVASFEVIEHIDDTTPYLAEIRRVLRPGGVALLTTPNATIRLDPGMKPWNPFHIREYVPAELDATVRKVFDDVSIRGLFATDALYRVEFERCQEALRGARQPRPRPTVSLARRSRNLAARAVKTVLPERALQSIRSRRAQRNQAASPRPRLDQSIVAEYSTRDLYYRDEELDGALDLMAVCRKTAPTVG
jgi:SAM-dependent methyltransferase